MGSANVCEVMDRWASVEGVANKPALASRSTKLLRSSPHHPKHAGTIDERMSCPGCRSSFACDHMNMFVRAHIEDATCGVCHGKEFRHWLYRSRQACSVQLLIRFLISSVGVNVFRCAHQGPMWRSCNGRVKCGNHRGFST